MDATLLLGLDGLAVERVETGEGGLPIVHVVTSDLTARGCPGCGVVATRVKERVVSRPRDLSCGGRPIALVWHKRRWVCREKVCSRRTFTEQIPARVLITGRARRSCGRAVADGRRTVAQAGRDHRMSWPTAGAAFGQYAAQALSAEPEPVAVLGIDETRRGRPVWVKDEHSGKWELVVDRWHIGFVDIGGGQGLLGQVEGRTTASVAGWLSARGKDWRDAVRYVVIDMCATFRAAIRKALPDAVIVVDHFHLVQLANTKLAEVGRRLTWKMRGRRGRTGDEEWDHRRLLRSNAENLTAEQIQTLERDLTRAGTYGKQILAGWKAKEKLRAMLALARTPSGPLPGQPSLARFLGLVRRPRSPAGTGNPGRIAPGLVERDRGVHHHRDQNANTKDSTA